MVAKRGRPSKSGDRYKCGKLKPADTSKQPISPALWQRIKTNGQKIGLDPRLGTELGRLALHDELTSMEVSAGFRIAEIYQAFEHFHGRTRSAAGSSFFCQFVADTEKPVEITRRRTDDYIDIDREEREREAREDFGVLQYYMPAAQRDLVEQVCVTSSPINPASFPVLKMVLQYFFEIFRDDKNYQSKRSKKFDANAPKIKFYRPKKDKAQKAEAAVEAGQPKPKPIDKRKLSYMQTLRILRPDLTGRSAGARLGHLSRVDRARGLPQRERDGAGMNALSKQEIAALREGDVVYVRMVVRKPLGEFGTIHCRIHSEETWRSHYVPVFPEHIVGKDASEAGPNEIAS